MVSPVEPIIFIIGAPASGKGTLCRRLSEDYGFWHLSIGEVLRELVSLSDTDKNIVTSVRCGELIPVEALASILRSQLEKAKSNGHKKILLDGFPRRLDQAAPIETLIGSPELVLFFNCPEKVAEERFLTRRLAGRETDDAQTFRKRYQEFSDSNPPILEKYRKEGKLIEINTSGETDLSYQRLMKSLEDTERWSMLAA